MLGATYRRDRGRNGMEALADDRRPLSLAELYSHTYQPVLGRCRALLGNVHDAEDVTQEVFRRAAERRLELEWPLPWMMRVAANICHNELRRRRREQHAVGRETSYLQGSALPDATELVAEPAVLLRLLGRLTPAERAVVAHRWRHGTTLQEAAGDLGIAGSTARNLLARARRKIGEELQRYCAGLGSTLGTPLTRLAWRVRELGSSLGLGRDGSTPSRRLGVGWLIAIAAPAAIAFSVIPTPSSADPPAPPPRPRTAVVVAAPAVPATGAAAIPPAPRYVATHFQRAVVQPSPPAPPPPPPPPDSGGGGEILSKAKDPPGPIEPVKKLLTDTLSLATL